MEFFTKAVSLIFSLSILVVLHELGHFIPAKLFKTRVEKFYLFFDPWFSLVKKKIGGTTYGIGWLPLGGYVKIAGMVDESMDKEQMAKPPEPWEFRSKPTWQRLIIMIGGVTVNAFLAWFIYSMSLFTWGNEKLPLASLENGISCTAFALDHGFQDGDKIVGIDGADYKYFGSVNADLILNSEIKTVEVIRNGQPVTINIPEGFGDMAIDSGAHRLFGARVPFIIDSVPMAAEKAPKSVGEIAGLKKGDQFLSVNGVATPYSVDVTRILKHTTTDQLAIELLRNDEKITVNAVIDCDRKFNVHLRGPSQFLQYEHYEYSFIESFPAGFDKSISVLQNYVQQFKKVGKHMDSVGGFGALGGLFPSSFSDVNYWQKFWGITALLSVILAFMNILPIPALDGGHVLFLIYEMIMRRKPGEKFMEYAQMGGMILLFGLMIFANGNDLIKKIMGDDTKKECVEFIATKTVEQTK
jgi:regulator of sigma E protease